ncbi:MAG: cation:proton antiporter [Myxococcota bacterium]
MPASSFLVELLILIAAAAAGVALFERLRLPAIAGFLVAGAVLGPGGLGLVEDSERVRQLAEFGVVFLLFEIGLEMPITRLRRLWRTVLVAGTLQVGGTIAVVAAIAAAFGLPGESAFVVGGLVAMSSTALVVRLLSQRGQVDAPHGQLVVGMLLFQDLCIVPLLLAIPVLAAGEGRSVLGILGAVAQAGVALLLLVLMARYALPRVLEWAVRVRSGDLLSLAAIGLVLGFAVSAQALGLTLAVGAFTAGLLLAASPYAHQLFSEVAPVRGVLLGVFFTAVGMLFDPVAAWSAGALLSVWVVGVVVVKTALVFAVVAWILRRGTRLALLTGLALAQTGEFSFVLGESARQAGLLDPTLYQVMVAGSIVTLIATPALFALGPPLASRFAEVFEATSDPLPAGAPREGHVLVLGYGLAGRTVARVLAASRIPYVVLDANPGSAAEARDHGEPVVYGDATRPAILERLGVGRARLVTIAISDPEAARRSVAVIRSLAPDVEIIVRTRYVAEVDALSELGADVVVVEEFEAAIDLVSAALRAFGFPAESVARFSEQMRDEGYEVLRAPPALALDPWLTELLSEVGTEWLEVSAGAADGSSLEALGVRARTGASVLAIERMGHTTANPAPDFVLAAGDRLLSYGSAEQLRRMAALLRGD